MPTGIVTSTVYDELNRPKNTSYTGPSSTPTVTYIYDRGFHGALTSVANSYSTTTYSYDALGRISASAFRTQTVPATPFAYTYSLADQLTSVTYPSGRQITYTLDAADRVSAVTGSLSGVPTNYAQSIAYTPASGISSMVTGSGNGALTSTLTWNDRLQLTGLNVTNPSTSQILGLSFYPCSGSATACSSGNNGNLQSQTISVPSLGSLTQTYSYDALNRLTAAAESSSTLEQYSYDGFGNRWVPNHNSSLPALSVETPTGNVYTTPIPNRITGWTYDNAGNILSVPLSQNNNRNFNYDGENRQVVATITGVNGIQASYAYDGNGLRA